MFAYLEKRLRSRVMWNKTIQIIYLDARKIIAVSWHCFSCFLFGKVEIQMGRALSQNLREEIFKRDNYTCRYCGKKFRKNMLDVDHIRPVCLGGDNRESNVATSCITCNRQNKKERRFFEYEDSDSQNEFDENYRKIVRNYGYYTNYIKKIFKRY